MTNPLTYTGTATVAVTGGVATITNVTETVLGSFALLVEGSIVMIGGGMGFVATNTGTVITSWAGWGGTASGSAIAWSGMPPASRQALVNSTALILANLNELNALPDGKALVASARDSLIAIDVLSNLFVLGNGTNAPPASPSVGDAYIVGSSPTGAWSGYGGKIAAWVADEQDGAPSWHFYTPFNGLIAYSVADGKNYLYLSGAWTDWSSLIAAGETSIASASTCDLGAAGSLFVAVTGTTTITSFGTGANKLCFVRFAGALTLTHNATSLILLGGASRTTAAGDVGIFASDASGNWRERAYLRAAADPGDYATKSGTETFANKTLTAPQISTISNTGTLTLPTSTDTLVGWATTDTLTNKTLTAPKISTISNTGTLTLPTSTDTLVGRATTDTLTNKTLTAPKISTISNTGTLTLPTSTDTLVGRATTDTLTNKTLTGPILSGATLSGATTLNGSGIIDTSGNIGIGTPTPQCFIDNPLNNISQNNARFGCFGIQSYAPTNGFLQCNTYYNGSNYIYQTTGAVSLFQFYNGDIDFRSAPSGTAAAVATLAYNMTIKNNGQVIIGTSTSPISGSLLDVAGAIFPHADNTYNLGSGSYRFGTIYAGTGTINTSGADTKENVRELSAAELAVAKALAENVRVFQFCDAVAAKGADKARFHTGMIYEEVVAAFAANGLDAQRYGIACSDPAVKTVVTTSPVTTQKQRMVTVTVERPQISVTDGVATLTMIPAQENQPVVDILPLLDVSGKPVLDADGQSRTYESPVMDDVTETVETETQEPDLDENGVQKTVVGLRYDELAQFVMAGIAARLAALESA